MEERLDFWRRAEKNSKNFNVNSLEFREQLKQVLDNAHEINLKKLLDSDRAKALGSCRPDWEVPPSIVQSRPEIKQLIRDLQGQYGLKTDLDQDEGFSFGYQLTLYFPTHFQIQVIKSNFSLYDAFAG